MNQKLLHNYVKRILRANIYDLARETQTDHMPALSRRFANNVYLKREDTQPVFSFKVRGAYNKIRQLDAEQRERGIITASAGNHAQGVAISAQKLGVKASIVMPITTPETKVKAVRSYGAKDILTGDDFDKAYEYACQLCQEKELAYIPPYDDVDVIAGQGTVAMELLRQFTKPIHALFVPVGGGGLIAGITAYIKYLRPDIRVFGVEPEDSNCLYEALQHGRRVKLKDVGLFADGVAVRQIGKLPFQIVKNHIDGVICVSSDEICAAVKDIFDDHRVLAEPSGALAVAGLKKYIAEYNISEHNLVAINSGANTTFERLAYISERAEIGEQMEAILAIQLQEKPGSFLRFCRALKKHNITEFNYRFCDSSEAHIFVGIRLRLHETTEQLIASLVAQGYQVTDMTSNSIAKDHVRHMVGGRAPKDLQDERIFSCTFPERPGALLNFLTTLGNKWNISLFHYRNHGAAYGRIVIGIQVPKEEREQLLQLLRSTPYRFAEQQDNPAYSCFLS